MLITMQNKSCALAVIKPSVVQETILDLLQIFNYLKITLKSLDFCSLKNPISRSSYSCKAPIPRGDW